MYNSDMAKLQLIYERLSKGDNLYYSYTIPIYVCGAAVNYTFYMYETRDEDDNILEPKSYKPQPGKKEFSDVYKFLKVLNKGELHQALIRHLKTLPGEENSTKVTVESLCNYLSKYNLWKYIPDGSPQDRIITTQTPAAPKYKFGVASEGGGSGSPAAALEKNLNGGVEEMSDRASLNTK